MTPETLTDIVDYISTGEIELTVEKTKSVVKARDVLNVDTFKMASDVFIYVEPNRAGHTVSDSTELLPSTNSIS